MTLRVDDYWQKAKGVRILTEAMIAERNNIIIQMESSDHEPLQMESPTRSNFEEVFPISAHIKAQTGEYSISNPHLNLPIS